MRSTEPMSAPPSQSSSQPPSPNTLRVAADWLEHACRGEDREDCQEVARWLRKVADSNELSDKHHDDFEKLVLDLFGPERSITFGI